MLQVILKTYSAQNHRRTLLDVADLWVADGTALPLSSERWMKSSHYGEESDNLGTDTPCFLNNRLHPTWCCEGGGYTAPCGMPVWSPAWHEPFSIMLPNCDVAARTHVLLVSGSTPLKTKLPLHRRVANLEKCIKDLQSKSFYKTRSHVKLLFEQASG